MQKVTTNLILLKDLKYLKNRRESNSLFIMWLFNNLFLFQINKLLNIQYFSISVFVVFLPGLLFTISSNELMPGSDIEGGGNALLR